MMTFKEEIHKPIYIFRIYEYDFRSLNNKKTIKRNKTEFQKFHIVSTENIYGLIINCKIFYSTHKEKPVMEKKHLPGFNHNQEEILINSEVLKQLSITLKTNNLRCINIKKDLEFSQISQMNRFMNNYKYQLSAKSLMSQFVLFQIYNLKLPDNITQRHEMAEVIDTVLKTNNDNKIEFYYRSD